MHWEAKEKGCGWTLKIHVSSRGTSTVSFLLLLSFCLKEEELPNTLRRTCLLSLRLSFFAFRRYSTVPDTLAFSI